MAHQYSMKTSSLYQQQTYSGLSWPRPSLIISGCFFLLFLCVLRVYSYCFFVNEIERIRVAENVRAHRWDHTQKSTVAGQVQCHTRVQWLGGSDWRIGETVLSASALLTVTAGQSRMEWSSRVIEPWDQTMKWGNDEYTGASRCCIFMRMFKISPLACPSLFIFCIRCQDITRRSGKAQCCDG